MSHDDASPDPIAHPVLRDDSDRLLRAVDELKALEREKRLEVVSSPPFHDLAREVERKAREVFRMAEQEEADGSGAEHGGTIEESPPDQRHAAGTTSAVNDRRGPRFRRAES